MHLKIRSVSELRQLTPADLEREANMVLYGHRDILDEALDRQIFKRLYIPRNLNKGLVYVVPKSTFLKIPLKCCDCGRPRSYFSGKRCKFCYLLIGRMKFYEAQAGAAWLDDQMFGGFEGGNHVGIAMPVTEWWDDTDMPTYRYIGNAKWSPKTNYGS